MASKLRREAKAAMADLQKYVAHDETAMSYLTKVQDLQAQLRRTNAELRTQAAEADERAKKAVAALAPTNARIAELEAELGKLTQKLTQITADKTRLLKEQARLQAELEPKHPAVEMTFDSMWFVNLSKEVRRRLRWAPPTSGFSRAGKYYEVRLHDVLFKQEGYDYNTLGMFVALMAMIGIPVGIEVPGMQYGKDTNIGSRMGKGQDKQMAKLCRWMRDWFIAPEDSTRTKLIARSSLSDSSDKPGAEPPPPRKRRIFGSQPTVAERQKQHRRLRKLREEEAAEDES